jgi:hypothetical protein
MSIFRSHAISEAWQQHPLQKCTFREMLFCRVVVMIYDHDFRLFSPEKMSVCLENQ